MAVVSLIKLFFQAEGRATTLCRGRKAVMLMVEQRLAGQKVFQGVCDATVVPGEDAQQLVQHRAL